MRIGHVVVLHVCFQIVIRCKAREVALLVLKRATDRILVGKKSYDKLARSEDIQHAFDQILVVVLRRIRLEAYV